MTDRDFESRFEDILLLVGTTPELIDQFTSRYESLLSDLRAKLAEVTGRGLTIDELNKLIVRGKELRRIGGIQTAFLMRIRNEAFIDEFETVGADLPAIDAG